MINLNSLARDITLKEGKKKNLNIGQVKEVMKLTLEALASLEMVDVARLILKYK